MSRLTQQLVTKLGYRVLAASNGHEALARELRARKYAGSILALTGSLDEDKLQGMLDLGAFDVIGKPPDMARLELAVHLGCVLAS